MATSNGLIQANRCWVQADELTTINLQTENGQCTEVNAAYDALSHGLTVTVRESDMFVLRRLLVARGVRV